MRVLCLNLQKPSSSTLAEAFLKFSPLVHFRTPKQIFIDITSSIPLWESEEVLLKDALKLARSLNLPATAAISDTAWGAQVFSEHFEEFIARPGEETQALAPLPVSSLLFFEGLLAWPEPQNILRIADFLQAVGLRYLAQLHLLDQNAFQERWGETGSLIWQRLHGLEKQIISPLLPTEPFYFYQHLDEPVENCFFLLLHIERSLVFLFARLEGRACDAQSLKLHLRCEYSKAFYDVSVTPVQASRDKGLFLDLLKQKIEKIDFLNPIRDFEIYIEPISADQRQMDFWQPQTSVEDKLQRLMSLLKQTDCEIGFLQLQNAVFPEDAFTLKKLITILYP